MPEATSQIQSAVHSEVKKREVLCSHCGLPVPQPLIRQDREEQFCCGGCEAVYGILHDCDLDEYYKLRDELSSDKPKPAQVSGKDFSYFDDPEFLKRFALPKTKGNLSVQLYVEGIHCVACSWLIEKVLMEREGAAFARLDIGKSIVEIVFDPAEVTLSRLAGVLDSIGYAPHPIQEDSVAIASRRETRSLLMRMGIAGAAAGNIMLLAVSLYAGEYTGIDVDQANLFRWISLGLSLPALLYSAQPFFKGAWSGLKHGMLHMDLPISLGILSAFAISLTATILGRGEVFYDTLTLLIFLLLCGRLLLSRATKWAMGTSEKLLDLEPRTARLLIDGKDREVSLSTVQLGNRLRVLPGETIPVDGILQSEFAIVGEAHLTGESEAVSKRAGDQLYAGSTVEQSPLEMSATAVGETTRLARLAQMMKEASSQRAPIVALHDRIAGYFVAAVLTLALITGVIWLMVDPSRALWNAAALLVITCPCALGLGTPVALAIAMGRAARR
ncbi:heavy metal translocating P-type ATPase metal-binding domain-containing protein, partial [bacterium]|nr:heavy metal translocating P-type ATPase metal-binding domain-containing protein [bacterium]